MRSTKYRRLCTDVGSKSKKKNSILKYGYQSRYSHGPVKEPITNQPLFIASTFPRLSFAPPLSALQAALRLAEEIGSFPQQCLRADRSSAIYSSYDAPSFKQVKPPLAPLSPCSAFRSAQTAFSKTLFIRNFQAMQYEMDRGSPVVRGESVAGATRFTTGAGRGGTFS